MRHLHAGRVQWSALSNAQSFTPLKLHPMPASCSHHVPRLREPQSLFSSCSPPVCHRIKPQAHVMRPAPHLLSPDPTISKPHHCGVGDRGTGRVFRACKGPHHLRPTHACEMVQVAAPAFVCTTCVYGDELRQPCVPWNVKNICSPDMSINVGFAVEQTSRPSSTLSRGVLSAAAVAVTSDCGAVDAAARAIKMHSSTTCSLFTDGIAGA